MSYEELSRPGLAPKAAPTVKATTETKVAPPWTVGSGLRARRLASLRLLPLACGHRDSWCRHVAIRRTADPEPGWGGMDLGYLERDYAGRLLAEAGYVA